ncbi:ECF RNA polymerase sigma factor SigW [Dictyobacter sp. S3.2.2.5]|uniref:ECF RNA polymerase sigma factor SigW n=1 Tax=Dictyobacter halimunensis TaxID=3026934 RepID=A0ABQ6FM47_9CHLR|nr:ECF RNA polymerase sigma factor SigW [Dictyobacter sp. S3.2.2.5]
MNVTEEELPILLAANLHQHFQQLVLCYQHRLYTFAYRLCAGQQNAEDIVQEAFVNAYVSLENYTPERIRTLKLRAWLYRVTLNVYTHSLRGTRLHVVPLDTTGDSPMLEIADRPEEQPECLFEQIEQQRELACLLARLPDKYRICITCYYFEHFTYQEIAELLDQPLGTVKSSVSRGIRQLRTLFEATSQQEGRKEKR